MGLLERLSIWLGIKKQQASVLCIGLDNSGKTTVINHFKPPQTKSEEIVPTIGYSVEKFSAGNMTMTVLDMSGQGRYRSLWEQYYHSTEAIIFVVDSSDKLRIVVAQEELNTLLEHQGVMILAEIKDKCIPICCLANKKDIDGALSEVEVAERMGLDSIKNKPYCIFASNAITGEGLNQAMDWLTDQIKQLKQQ